MRKVRSKLEEILTEGKFAVTAQISSPQHAGGDSIVQQGRGLFNYVDAINVTDNQSAVVSLSSVAAAAILMRQQQEPVMHVSCRDRNRIALQSDLLGAYALGIRNVLCLSGDHPALGNQPGAKSVYDLDTINLITLVKQLGEEGTLLGGIECLVPPRFYIGCVINPLAFPRPLTMLQLEKKTAAGADFVQSVSVFDMEGFAGFMEDVRTLGLHNRIKILAGVRPLQSVEEAVSLQRCGIAVPNTVIERMRLAEDQKAEGLEICIELISTLRNIPGVAGVHITTSNWENIIPFIVERAELRP